MRNFGTSKFTYSHILRLPDLHPVDPALQFCVWGFRVRCDDPAALVCHDIHLIFLRKSDDLFICGHRKGSRKHRLPGLAVDDPPAVEGKNVSAVFLQAKLFCERHYALRGASRREDHLFSALLRLHECRFRPRCDHLVPVRQRAVKVQDDDLVRTCHIFFCLHIFSCISGL